MQTSTPPRPHTPRRAHAIFGLLLFVLAIALSSRAWAEPPHLEHDGAHLESTLDLASSLVVLSETDDTFGTVLAGQSTLGLYLDPSPGLDLGVGNGLRATLGNDPLGLTLSARTALRPEERLRAFHDLRGELHFEMIGLHYGYTSFAGPKLDSGIHLARQDLHSFGIGTPAVLLVEDRDKGLRMIYLQADILIGSSFPQQRPAGNLLFGYQITVGSMSLFDQNSNARYHEINILEFRIDYLQLSPPIGAPGQALLLEGSSPTPQSASLLAVEVDAIQLDHLHLGNGVWLDGSAGVARLQTLQTEDTSEPQALYVPNLRLRIGTGTKVRSWVETDTFHRIDPSGTAIDTGARVSSGIGVVPVPHLVAELTWSVIFPERRYQGPALGPSLAEPIDEATFFGRGEASLRYSAGAMFSELAVYAEQSDRVAPLEQGLQLRTPRQRDLAGAELQLGWSF